LQQVFICDFCEGVEARASAACEDDAFHILFLQMNFIWETISWIALNCFQIICFRGLFLHRMCAVYLNVVFGLLLRVGGSYRNI